jgi:hypothetical protein
LKDDENWGAGEKIPRQTIDRTGRQQSGKSEISEIRLGTSYFFEFAGFDAG